MYTHKYNSDESTLLSLLWFLPKDMFIDFREDGAGREQREREEKHWCERDIHFLPPVHALLGSNQQPRHVHWLRIIPINFWFTGQCFNHLSHLAKATHHSWFSIAFFSIFQHENFPSDRSPPQKWSQCLPWGGKIWQVRGRIVKREKIFHCVLFCTFGFTYSKN